MVYVLNRPFVTGLLLVIGLMCLYVEFSAPSGIAATIAGLCFVLFFWSRVLGGTAGWLEVVLFLFGAVLVLVEIFLVPRLRLHRRHGRGVHRRQRGDGQSAVRDSAHHLRRDRS